MGRLNVVAAIQRGWLCQGDIRRLTTALHHDARARTVAQRYTLTDDSTLCMVNEVIAYVAVCVLGGDAEHPISEFVEPAFDLLTTQPEERKFFDGLCDAIADWYKVPRVRIAHTRLTEQGVAALAPAAEELFRLYLLNVERLGLTAERSLWQVAAGCVGTVTLVDGTVPVAV